MGMGLGGLGRLGRLGRPAPGKGGGGLAALWAGGAAGAWYDPSDLSSLYQDSAGTTPVTADNQPVGMIRDKSGNGNHWVQATSGQRPVYRTSGGLSWLQFDGSDDYMGISTISLSSSMAVATALLTTDRAFLALYNAALSKAVGISKQLDTSAASIGSGTPAQRINGALVTNRRDMLDLAFSGGAATLLEIRGADLSGYADMRFGGYTNYQFGGQFYGLIIATEARFAANRAAVLAWLAAKSGGVYIIDDDAGAVLTPAALTDSMALVARDAHFDGSAFSRLVFTTTATYLLINTYNDTASLFPSLTKIGVYVDGAYFATLNPTQPYSRTFALTLPAGTKTVQLVSAVQSKPATILGTSVITSVQANAPMTQTFPAAAKNVLIYGDSITVGDGTQLGNVQTDAYAMRLRAGYTGGQIGLEAWGYRALNDDASTTPLIDALVAKLGSRSPTAIMDLIGTNDYGLARQSAASFGTQFAALLDAWHTAYPSIPWISVSPLARTSEVANSFGDTLGAYRAAKQAACAARSSYVTFVDGSALLTAPGDLADGVHPTVAGHAKLATALSPYLP